MKYSRLDEYRVLYEWLCMVKDWRNGAAHGSLSATESEIDWAISVLITMYFYATGACITELESARDSDDAPGRAFTPRVYRPDDRPLREAAENETPYRAN